MEMSSSLGFRQLRLGSSTPLYGHYHVHSFMTMMVPAIYHQPLFREFDSLVTDK